MKKILFLLSIVLLSACGDKSNRSNTIHAKEDTVYFRYTKTFKYKGHFYINFGDKGVVHDPDCRYCYNKFD